MPDRPSDDARRQVRLATAVIVVSFLAWFAGSALGGRMGWPVRYAFLLDLACMAALVWALVVLFRVWRRGQNNGV